MLKRLNKNEHLLIKEFTSHQIFRDINCMDWDKLLPILIQRRFLSKSLINIYEEAIDLLLDDDVKQTVRSLLNEEFVVHSTRGEPLTSHRELLFKDLLHLGATRQQILKSSESDITKNTIKECFNILSEDFNHKHFQVGLITALRFMTEVLVAEEYKCLWGKMKERLSPNIPNGNKPRSEFFFFHMIHDDRECDVGQERVVGGATHSQRLADHINKLICCEEASLYEEAENYCMFIERQVFKIKYKFYDQFIF
jgi:hypothetical protein